ncbi:MAG: hypothetical protein MUF15_00425 [Acidobacteria bacterium]|jgi:hypothetical protein|nr:hypothetical protein [Acidobacteriota bacterium]
MKKVPFEGDQFLPAPFFFHLEALAKYRKLDDIVFVLDEDVGLLRV